MSQKDGGKQLCVGGSERAPREERSFDQQKTKVFAALTATDSGRRTRELEAELEDVRHTRENGQSALTGAAEIF